MTEIEWFAVDGMVIAGELDPLKLASFLKSHSVVAKLDWYDATPQLVGIRVVTDGTHVGRLTPRAKHLKPGMTTEHLAEQIADKFEAEVLLGEFAADKYVDQVAEQIAAKASAAQPADETEETLRVVEIGGTPASAVPLLAAFEGVDIGELELAEEKRALLAQLPSKRSGYHFGDFPLVSLTMHGDEFQATLVKDSEPENVVGYNWGMNELVVAGGKGWDHAKVPEQVYELVGARSDLNQIVQAVGDGDAEAAFAATKVRGPRAVRQLVNALGLSDDVAEFLLGWKTAEQVPGVLVHHSRGISNAIGRSVDILIDERKEGSRFWDTYSNIIETKPWLVSAVASLEALAGVGLLAVARPRQGKRSKGAKLGTLVGALLLLDSMAEVTLAKYTLWRKQRQEQ